MRILASSVDAHGHLAAVLPLARAAGGQGHTVAVAVGTTNADRIARTGLAVHPIPPPDDALDARRRQVVGEVMAALLAGDRETGDALVISGMFGHVNAAAGITAMLQAVRDFEPDLLLVDPFESAAPIAAVVAGTPVALGCWGPGALMDRSIGHLVAGVEEVARAHGAEPEELLALLRAAPRFSILPSSLDTPGHEAVRWRPTTSSPDATLPDDLADVLAAGDRPTVYATMGSVVGAIPPFARRFAGAVLPGLEAAGVRCLLTVGEDADVGMLGPLPDDVLVRPWVAHAAVMPHVDVVLSHGGINTVLDAIAARRPQAVVPMQAGDQFLTGERLAALGAARCLVDAELTPAAVAESITAMVGSATAADAVDRLAGEVEAMPAADDVVDRLVSAAGA